MKKVILSAIVIGVGLSSCNKKVDCEEYYYEKEYEFCGTDHHYDKDDYDKKGEYKDKESFEKEIVEEIVKSEDCECIVSGVVEYYEDGNLTATVDYGNGTCDEVATKTTADGTVSEFNPCEKDKDYYSKEKYGEKEYSYEADKDYDKKKSWWKKKKKYSKEECEEMVFPNK